ncbi:enoyl- hydratase [Colletotrichum kahawae]|uniref:Enoyl- hydratase n=1 Tax=Colletotrichum kahawae TaxID=34407 RepID=A0AAD9YBE7_COLKA|nr:enoyl- hydratase [Colletotrichum kahawae]
MDSLQTLELTVEADKGVALVRFNRPAKRNAFSQVMIGEIIATLVHLDALEAVRAVVITGGPDGPFCGTLRLPSSFPASALEASNPFYGAAGMDLNELVQISTAEAHNRAFLKDLTDAFARFSKPIIAAVVGFALGGGCEIALACDMIYAAEDASFGLPEIKIGTIPGAGGTQRLARALGKHKAMEFVLTGDSASGAEFERLGVVNKVFPRAEVVPAALKLAERIAVMSGPVIKTAKQAVLTVENSHLDAGMTMEKSLYYSTFSLGDFNEGMSAFLQKRRPEFKHQ